MIRQRVNRHGVAYPLAPAEELPATSMDRNEVGVVKPGPILKWMERKREWDMKYARYKKRIHNERVKECMHHGEDCRFEPTENPPPSALAGRKGRERVIKKPRKSMGLLMWSSWGSKHDETTMRREEEAVEGLKKQRPDSTAKTPTAESVLLGREVSRGARRKSSARAEQGQQYQSNNERSRSRRRTITISDQGQTEGWDLFSDPEKHTMRSTSQEDSIPTRTSPAFDQTHLTPMFLPKYKSPRLAHLREGSRDDDASIRTDHSRPEMADNASTTAVFAASGISQVRKVNNSSSFQTRSVDEHQPEDNGSNYDPRSDRSSITNVSETGTSDRHRIHGEDDGGIFRGAETPASRRSVERLVNNQVGSPEEEQHDYDESHPSNSSTLRSPSSVAVVGHPGVVDEVAQN